jgi:pectate lyase
MRTLKKKHQSIVDEQGVQSTLDFAKDDGIFCKELGCLIRMGWSMKHLIIVFCSLFGLVDLAMAVSHYLKNHDEWFGGDEARLVAQNILSHQSPNGTWPKNRDTGAAKFDGQSELRGTFDNGATVDELRFLARYYHQTQEKAASLAIIKGVDTILKAQYPNGGWPQSYPPGKGYARHITFNDGTMVGLMKLIKEVESSEHFAFIGAARRQSAGRAFQQGVKCILKCQIRIGGELTVWCAQHDEIDFTPRPARSFELASLSGCESVGIVRLLMSIEKPTRALQEAVDAAIAWLRKSKIEAVKLTTINGDRVLIQEKEADGLWARFYDLKTNQPIFSDRDGIAREALSEIGFERRNGYSWYGPWAKRLIEKDYPEWRKNKLSGIADF